MKLILASAQDPAAKNIATRLLELYDFEKSPILPNSHICGQALLVHVAGGVTQLTSIPVDADEIIVASRHASEAGTPSFTAHVPGELEGRELAIASPQTVKAALKALVAARDELGLSYEVSLEATHHGPTKLDVPVTFVEIGSSLGQWVDKDAGEAVARAIMAAASPAECQNAVGLGGPHYAPRHTEIALRTDVGVGHILPKYAHIDEELLEQAIVRTSGGVKLLALDWKGMSGEQRAICQAVAGRLGVRAQRAREILDQAKV